MSWRSSWIFGRYCLHLVDSPRMAEVLSPSSLLNARMRLRSRSVSNRVFISTVTIVVAMKIR